MADVADERRPIVCDVGSFAMKAGVAGEEMPSVSFPAVVTQPSAGSADKNTFVGYDAIDRAGSVGTVSPIEHGIVTNWDAMERVFHHTFYNALRVDPEQTNIFVTEPCRMTWGPSLNREKIAQVMFETFNVAGMFSSSKAPLSLYAAGRGSGIVLDCGDGVSHAAPVYEGYVMPHAVGMIDLAGQDLTEYMVKLLMEGAVSLSGSSAEREIVRDIKEKTCYVALDFDEEMKKQSDPTIETQFELPDMRVVTIKSQRFRCPEALFKPHLVGLGDADGYPALVTKSIGKCDIDVRRPLFENIVLSGGTTMFPGMAERLTKELVAAAPAGLEPRVIAPPERKYSVWIGGSILSSLTTFQTQWVLRSEYDESGVNVVHQKCLS